MQGASPQLDNGDGAGSYADMNGVSPAESSMNGKGSNRDEGPLQQGSQGVEQPAGTTFQGSHGQGAVPQSSSNNRTRQ